MSLRKIRRHKCKNATYSISLFALTGHQGIFSTLKQSDMCLVCIAFASWVLRSSDPEAADAWKAGTIISEFIFLYQS